MEPFPDPSIPLAPPNSPLSALLTNFFDPGHTLQTIAKSLGLTLEGLLNYIATPEVAAALDHAEELFLRRAALRATAAIESVLQQLQALPPLPATPSESDTDRHRKNLDVSRRAADLLRKTISPHRAPASRAPRERAGTSRTAAFAPTSRPEPPRTREPGTPRVDPSPGDRPPWNVPAISFRSPAPVAPRYVTATAGGPLTPDQACALEQLVVRNPSLYQRAPALFGTPYTHGQAG